MMEDERGTGTLPILAQAQRDWYFEDKDKDKGQVEREQYMYHDHACRKAGGVNARGVDDPALPAKRQSSLADLLGPRFAPKKVESPLVEPLIS